MSTQIDLTWLHSVCLQNGLDLAEEPTRQLSNLVNALIEWNQKINLISRRDEEHIWSAHILHSLTIALLLEIPRGAKVLDLGTGGGLPGLPLKIVRPDLELTLLDSTQKKINVVREIIAALGLQQGTHAVWGRAEDIGKQQSYARKFDFVIARAVASLEDLVRWSAPFLRSGQTAAVADEAPSVKIAVRPPALITLKGGDLEQEIARLKFSGNKGKLRVIDLTLKGSRQLEEGEKKMVIVNF